MTLQQHAWIQDPDGSTAIDFSLSEGENALDTRLTIQQTHTFSYTSTHDISSAGLRLKSPWLMLHLVGLKGGEAASLATDLVWPFSCPHY